MGFVAFTFLGGFDATLDVDHFAVADVVLSFFGVSLIFGLLLNDGDVVAKLSDLVVDHQGQVNVALVFGQILEVLFLEADCDDCAHSVVLFWVIRKGRFCGLRMLPGPLDCWRAQCP